MDDEQDESQRPLGVLAAVSWCTISFLLTMLIEASLEALRPGAASDPWVAGLSALVSVSIVVFGVARLHAPEGSLRALTALAKPRAVHVAIALVIGLALCVGLEWTDEQLARVLPSPDSEGLQTLLASPISRRVAFALSFAIVRPLCDEILFRGVLFTGLAKVRPLFQAALTVILLQALREGLTGDPRIIIEVLLVSAASTYVRILSGTVITTFVLYVAFSLDVIAVMFRPSLEHLTVPHVVGVSALVVAVTCLYAARRLPRGPAREEMPET